MPDQDQAKKFTIQLICDLIKHKYYSKKETRGRPIKRTIHECVENILKVLRTGQQWDSLGKGYSTYHKRFCQWSTDGIFEEAFYALQKISNFANSMGTCFYIDACVIRNKCGSDDVSYCPKIKCKRSCKITVIVGSNGLPISLVVSKASVHDVQFVLPALSRIKLRKRKIKTLVGDKGYLSLPLKKKLAPTGTNLLYGQRKNLKAPIIWTPKEQKHMDNRFLVESFFSTLLFNRRLNVRYERKSKHFESMIYLAMVQMISKKVDLSV